MGRKRIPGGPTSQGYGAVHQQLRAAALAAWRPGMRCARCGQPMTQRWMITRSGKIVSAIHLDHSDDRLSYIGLSHHGCNTGKRGKDRTPRPAFTPGRRW